MIDATIERVCVVMMSAVGDAVHVLPVVNALKRQHPRCHITWVIQPGPATLVNGHKAVDELVIFRRDRGWRGFAEIRRDLAAQRFDVVIDLQVYFKAGIVTSFTHAPIKLGFDRERARDFNWLFTTHRIPARTKGQHVQDQYFEFLEFLGVPHEPVEWDIGPWENERAAQREFFDTLDRPAAALVIATSKPEKDWFPERWAEVADALSEEFGLQPVLVGGRSARELKAEEIILSRTRSTPVSRLGSGLRALVGILDGAALVISPDTGPLHVAVALNRPVISLMGYTNPLRTGPYRRFRELLIDAYGEPGETYEVTMETRAGRMSRIGVRDVLEKVQLWRERYGPSWRGSVTTFGSRSGEVGLALPTPEHHR